MEAGVEDSTGLTPAAVSRPASLLEYENQIFLDCFHEDGLLIMAR